MLEKEKVAVLPSFIEEVVEIKNCKHCGAMFEITDKDLEFYEKVSPIFNIQESGLFGRPVSDNEFIKDLGNGKIKYLIPTPSLCPDCRLQRRLSWRNERSLYKRSCDATGENIISIYSPDKPYKVYNQDFWWSDKWVAMDYSIDYDFGKTFFEQFNDLLHDVPHSNLFITGVSENSPYINCAGGNAGAKNCYLIFNSGNCENSGYLHGTIGCKNSYDCYFSNQVENCYEVTNCFDCYKLFFSENSYNCSESYFLKNCEGCNNCIGCFNLKNNKYCIFNKQYTKEEFLLYRIDILDFKEDFYKFTQGKPNLSLNIINSFNVSGDYIINSKDCSDSYEIHNGEDLSFSHRVKSAKDCYDIYGYGYMSELLYENVGSGGESHNLHFTSCVEGGSYNYYCFETKYCSNCFGCVGLRNKSYCILNKQYTKEEYNLLVPKIIEHMQKTGEWGEFFPSSLSPFGYNETVANEYFPLKREDVTERPVSGETGLVTGKVFNWSDYESPKPNVEKVIPASKLPENISKIPDDILNWAIECEVTKKPFRIIREELDFYRKHNLPIPRRHPDQRHLDRMKLRNPRRLYDRNCNKCGKDIKTTYSPKRPEIVYCEECYNKEVY